MRSAMLQCMLLATLVLLSGASAASAAEIPVDLELVLAVDVSRSMDDDEQVLQRRGYAAAFRDRDLVSAIRQGPLQRIAVTYVEWAGSNAQRVHVPWLVVEDERSADVFARAIEVGRAPSLERTSISRALEFAADLIAGNGIAGRRRVIDVSGDGPNNAGGPVAAVRDILVEEGIVINGLPIMTKPATSGGIFDYEHLDRYYRDCVIGGNGAFIVTVSSLDRFADAIKRKLLLEISGLSPRLVLAAQAGTPGTREDCLLGEKRWRSWMGPGGAEP